MAGGGIKFNNIKVIGGADGKTPVFKIENGILYYTYGSGENAKWYNLGLVKGADGQNGKDGKNGSRLVSQILEGQDENGGNIYKQTFDDGTTAYFVAPKGEDGKVEEIIWEDIVGRPPVNVISGYDGTRVNDLKTEGMYLKYCADEGLPEDLRYKNYYVWIEVEGIFPYEQKQTITLGTIYYYRTSNPSTNSWNDWEEIDLTKQGQGGGTQVQADWNEEDTTNPAYIKNKPNLSNFETKDTQVVDDTSTSITLTPQANHEYYYGELESLSLSFDNANLGDNFYILFKSGTIPTTLTINSKNALFESFVPKENQIVEISGKFDGENWVLNFYSMKIQVQIKIPEEYQRVEFLRSTGTQYIDTGFIGNQDTRVVMDFQVVELGGIGIFGSRTTGTSNNFIFNVTSSGYFANNYGANGSQNITTADNERHLVDKNKNVLYFDGEVTSAFSYQNFETPKNLYLFAISQANFEGGYLLSSMILYSCDIYDNDTLIRKFIPCYRKADNIAGLYDIVNNEFYANSATKGDDFILGANM